MNHIFVATGIPSDSIRSDLALVSDFFSAYDGLDCLQQRCLIHLMRDMNRAMLDNPFDQELQTESTFL